jgi:hypothetical protein
MKPLRPRRSSCRTRPSRRSLQGGAARGGQGCFVDGRRDAQGPRPSVYPVCEADNASRAPPPPGPQPLSPVHGVSREGGVKGGRRRGRRQLAPHSVGQAAAVGKAERQQQLRVLGGGRGQGRVGTGPRTRARTESACLWQSWIPAAAEAAPARRRGGARGRTASAPRAGAAARRQPPGAHAQGRWEARPGADLQSIVQLLVAVMLHRQRLHAPHQRACGLRRRRVVARRHGAGGPVGPGQGGCWQGRGVSARRRLRQANPGSSSGLVIPNPRPLLGAAPLHQSLPSISSLTI